MREKKDEFDDKKEEVKREASEKFKKESP